MCVPVLHVYTPPFFKSLLQMSFSLVRSQFSIVLNKDNMIETDTCIYQSQMGAPIYTKSTPLTNFSTWICPPTTKDTHRHQNGPANSLYKDQVSLKESTKKTKDKTQKNKQMNHEICGIKISLLTTCNKHSRTACETSRQTTANEIAPCKRKPPSPYGR